MLTVAVTITLKTTGVNDFGCTEDGDQMPLHPIIFFAVEAKLLVSQRSKHKSGVRITQVILHRGTGNEMQVKTCLLEPIPAWLDLKVNRHILAGMLAYTSTVACTSS